MKKLLACLSLTLALSATSFGQLYFGAGAGYFWPESDVNVASIIGGGSPDMEDKVGAIAHLGYKLPDNGFHFEFLFQYFETKAEVGVNSTGAASVAATGTNLGNGFYRAKADFTYMSLMGHVYYDILDGMPTDFEITIGGGAGLTEIDQTATVEGPNGRVSGSGDEWVFTWMASAGLNYNVSDHLRIGAVYQYVGYDDANFSPIGTNVPYNGMTTSVVELFATFSF